MLESHSLKISIIIPAFNQAETISRTLNSFFCQTNESVEVIVVNDGSSDNTSEVISDFQKKYIIRYYQTDNRGVGAARNLGAGQAKGRYLIFLDSDDELMPQYIEKVSAVIKNQNPDFIFVGAGFYLDTVFKKNVLPDMPYGKPSEEGLFLAGTFCVRKEVFDLLGGYDVNIRYGENTEFSIRAQQHQFSKVFIKECLLRVNQKSIRSSAVPPNLIQSINYTLKKHKDYFKKYPVACWGYLQILAVSYLRIGDVKQGRKMFINALKIQPSKIITLFRLLITFIPLLRRRIYGA